MKKSVWSGGHTRSVLSLDHSEDEVLASGAEDGFVSLWSNDGVPRFKFSVAFGDSHDVTSVCFCSKESKHLYVSCGKKICFFDTRNVSSPVWQIEHSKDEINQIALNHKSSFLAAADDSSEIQIFELPSAKPFKTLSRRHTDICSCVQFRPQRPWEVISGGMDYNIFNWDFSSGRPVCLVNIQEIISADAGDEMENNYVVNPPYINSIHMSIESRRFACGLGNGNIAMFQFEGKKKFRHTYNLKAHSQGVSQVHFPKFQASKLLLSGGNDCKLVLWHYNDQNDAHNELDRGCSSGYQPISAAHVENHGNKVNWLCTANLYRNLIFVADNSKNISVYDARTS